MRRFAQIIAIILISSACQAPHKQQTEIIELSGTWKFQLDPEEIGMENKWFNEVLDDSIELPGTTDENRKGIFIDEKAVDRLSRVWYWKGAAWYQKEVDVPSDWSGKNVKLLLERTKDTHVWLDDIHCGYDNILSAPQFFDLSSAIKPGKQKITVLVNNANLPPVGPSHAVDERTQTNWNGIVGKIEMRATDQVWIEEVQAYPDIVRNRLKIRMVLGNMSGIPANVKLLVRGESWNTSLPRKYNKYIEKYTDISHNQTVEFYYEFNKQAPLWDEFDPALIKLSVKIAGKAGKVRFADKKQIDVGMRVFKRAGKYILLNGKRIFLRGRTDSANYPLTGYPPMKKEEWLTYFRLLKSYGINHWRFHSWCPPEAALSAADEVGVYLQPELPNKRSGMDNKSMKEEDVRKLHNIDYLEINESVVNLSLKNYLKREGELILNHFGNHPSFAMFTLGNELGRNEGMFELIQHFKKIDSRKLYAQGSNNMHWNPSFAEGDDFWVICRTEMNLPVRGSFATVAQEVVPHIDNIPPSTLTTYNDALENVEVPVIGHETGQFQVSPDFSEIEKFTGVTRARNYEIFRDRLEKANLLDQYQDFVRASGKLSMLCYREDIETALRTPDFAGFQLLDVQDFPGQGTALVGFLNAFMEPKGIVEPEEWRQFCSEVVPLLKMEKYTWTHDETFVGYIDIAHYGPEDYKQAEITWQVLNKKGNVYAEGKLQKEHLAGGGLAQIGEISFGLAQTTVAEKLEVIVSLEGTNYRNVYDIWVYPETIDNTIPAGVLVSKYLDADTKKHLQGGGRAIIIPDHDQLDHCINGAFQTDFWCYPMFARGALRNGIEPAPGSLGFICDPESPLLQHFPTEFHSNWQWWHLVKNCKPIILDETPAEYKPLIQTIDNFARNHKLGMVFETKFGKGNLLVCAIDLLKLQDKPEARQLYFSLLEYVKSENFDPQFELHQNLLSNIIPSD